MIEQILQESRCLDGQPANEKMFNVISGGEIQIKVQ
jgi:hypothetical protein